MKAVVASVELGGRSRKGTGGPGDLRACQAPGLSPCVFPASLFLLELTLARSRELALNYLTFSHIGLLASGRKSFSGLSSIFFLCFQMGPFQPECISFLLYLTEATPEIVTFFLQAPYSSSLGGNI